MTYWKTKLMVLATFFAAGVVSGCSQPIYLREYDDFAKTVSGGLPADLPSNACISEMRTTEFPARPMTVNDLDRKPRYITLSECIAMALENGSVGVQSINSIFNSINIQSQAFTISSVINDLVTFNGVQAVGSDSIRVFAIQPAITQTDIEASLSRYDVVMRSIVGFHTVDQNPGPSANGVINNGSAGNGQFTDFGVSLEKALPTGGLASITFGSPTNQNTSNTAQNFYSRFANQSVISGVNGYTPDLRFSFNQPLLHNFGPDINSLLQAHPMNSLGGAQQYGGSAAATAPALALARINFNQSRAEFERIVNYMVLNVEATYYVLYGSYVNLYSTEQALKQAHKVWEISKAKYEAGSIPITQYAQTGTQLEDFRSQRITAISNVLEKERALRVLCGMKLEDGERLIPVDTPTVQEFKPDWDSAAKDALALRPELIIAREDVKRRQLELIRERNGLLPDVRLEASYALHGLGTRLDGDGVFPPFPQGSSQTDNALRDLAGMHYGDYNFGVVASVPLGYRAQHASIRAANLRLAQSYIVLRDQERKALNNLEVAYRLVTSDYDLIQRRRAGREWAALQVEARFKEFKAGKTTVDFVLTAQQQWATALSQEYQAIANYNLDLAAFQFVKGTLLQHDNITIMESQLPGCIQVRAVENERQRAQSLVVLERAAVVQPIGDNHLPTMPAYTAPSLPSLRMDDRDTVRVPPPSVPPIQVQVDNTGSNPMHGAAPLPTGSINPPMPSSLPPAINTQPAILPPATMPH
jgi:outer membrane protein TolC